MADTTIDGSQRQNNQRIADLLEAIRVRHGITASSTPDLQQGVNIPAIVAALERFRSTLKSIFAEDRQALQDATDEDSQQLIHKRSTLKSTVEVQIPQSIVIPKPKVDSPIPDSQNVGSEYGFTQPLVTGMIRFCISPFVTRARFQDLSPRMVDDVRGLAFYGCSINTHLFDPGGTNCVKDCGFYQSWNFIEESLLSVEMVDTGLRNLAGGCSNLRKLVVANTSELGLLTVTEACSRLQELELHKCVDSVLLGIGAFENLQILRSLGNFDPLYNSLVSDIGLMILAQGCMRLVKLELVGCEGGFDGVKEIDQCCQMLEELTVCDHRMKSSGVGGLGYCENLKTLKLVSCKKIDHDPSGLSECLSCCCPALERLHLEKCQLRDKNAVKALFKMCEVAREIVFQDCWGLDNDIFSLATDFGRVKLLYLEGCSLLYFSRFEKPFKDQRNYQSEGRVMELLQKPKEAGLVKLMVMTSLSETELHELQETAEIDVADMEKKFGNEQTVVTRLKKKNDGKDDELQSNITMVESPKFDENMGGFKEERKSCFRNYKGQKTTIAQPVNTEQGLSYAEATWEKDVDIAFAQVAAIDEYKDRDVSIAVQGKTVEQQRTKGKASLRKLDEQHERLRGGTLWDVSHRVWDPGGFLSSRVGLWQLLSSQTLRSRFFKPGRFDIGNMKGDLATRGGFGLKEDMEAKVIKEELYCFYGIIEQHCGKNYIFFFIFPL